MMELESREVAYRTFCRRWRDLLPTLVIMKPMTDLCWTCQQHGTAVQNASPLEKSAALQDYLDHLHTVTTERSYYTTILKECTDSILTHHTVNGTFAPPPLHTRVQANSVRIKAHYSFDYAQQVNR